MVWNDVMGLVTQRPNRGLYDMSGTDGTQAHDVLHRLFSVLIASGTSAVSGKNQSAVLQVELSGNGDIRATQINVDILCAHQKEHVSRPIVPFRGQKRQR